MQLACPNNFQTEIQIWYDYCMVWYSTDNFIGKVDNTIKYEATDLTYAPDPISYVESVKLLMDSLLYEANFLSKKSFGVRKIQLLNNPMLYGYFDCTLDISAEDCTTCFTEAMRETELWCITRRDCWVLTPSFNARFSRDPVHVDMVNAPLITDNRYYGGSHSRGGF
ncbi:cysteine-rich repeat secretory protein 55-like [Camellia sinensis]|uniref:Gnk2-homologous domain-containing protein n=1 Tax=Camellia sinensis var. sinensis TaxID=542762 RepID=A0A4S4F2Q7_CAMSN|nr:cysteine-rich repeat secretory protein 55-like [Camellia sinensis]THG23783.1 hypothetical protein TEA_011673 [Camellia sinensis var. sinensis]